MGFAVYRGGDWRAEEFDTGASKIWASLANIPRQILEAAQMRKEGELKERSMQDKEAETRNQKQRSDEMMALQRGDRETAAKYRTEDIAREDVKLKTVAGYRTEDIAREDKKLADETAFRERQFAEQQKNNQAERAQTLAQMKLSLSKVGGENREGVKTILQSDLQTKEREIVGHVFSNGTKFVNQETEAGKNFLGEILELQKAPGITPSLFFNSFSRAYQELVEKHPEAVNVNEDTLKFEKQKRLFNTLNGTYRALVRGKIDPTDSQTIPYNGTLMEKWGKERMGKQWDNEKKKWVDSFNPKNMEDYLRTGWK